MSAPRRKLSFFDDVPTAPRDTSHVGAEGARHSDSKATEESPLPQSDGTDATGHRNGSLAAAASAGFVQLDELVDPAGGSWQRRARWIKYEQTAEADAERWGRPHVAPLSFRALLALRRCLAADTVQLDLAAANVDALWVGAVAALTAGGRVPAIAAPALLATLQAPHTPLERVHRFSLSAAAQRKHSRVSLQSAYSERRRSSGAARPERKKSVLGALAAAAAATTEAGGRARADSVLRCLPPAAEAALLLVGAADCVPRTASVFLRLQKPLQVPDALELPLPVRFVFVLLGPPGADPDYAETGRALGALLAHAPFRTLANAASTRRDLLAGIDDFLDGSVVLPPGDWEHQALPAPDELCERLQRGAHALPAAPKPAPTGDEENALLSGAPLPPYNPLHRTGRIFGGLLRDMQRRYRHYRSDLRDGLTAQCAAAAVFMYFAALSSAIAFGGLYSTKTGGAIGVSETLLATSAGGVLFSLMAGQPLMITGATGPLLLLDDALARFCVGAGLDFLAARAAAGAWMLAVALLVAAVEGSSAVKYITRFTEDIFACLICLIFIWEPVSNIAGVYRAHPLDADYCTDDNGNITLGRVLGNMSAVNTTAAPLVDSGPFPNTALFCTMLTLGTFIVAYYLRIFRNGKFLGRSARRALGDFGVPLAIALMVGVSLGAPVWTRRLQVPAGLATTTPRPWLVPLLPGFATLPPWAMLAMAAPALMIYIVVFLETHIAELIVGKPERRLQKGSGLHLDVVVMSLVNAVCGLLGAPWQCVATVRSVSHVAALTEMSTTHAPGDKPFIVGVAEQRVTGLVVALLVGLSVLLAPLLKLVPEAVLFGVFLYMGISALAGVQLWERTLLLLQPPKHHGGAAYVRHVPTRRLHAYTLLQLGLLTAMMMLKASRAALALPLGLAALVPLRLLVLPHLWPPRQLQALDGDPTELDKVRDDEPDFYEEAPLPG